MTLAGTCSLDAAGAAVCGARAAAAAGADAAASSASASASAGRMADAAEAPLPPRIRRTTKMTHRIQNLYGDAAADRRIMCQHCSRRIEIGSKMRRVRRTGNCWHEVCYSQAGQGGLLPPKIHVRRTMTRRIKKMFGRGDDHSVLCQMCGVEIEVGVAMRRAPNTRMCWHDTCYGMTWGGGGKKQGALAPPREAYIVSNTAWRRMLSACFKCAGSRLCDHHRHVEQRYRVPRKAGGGAGRARHGACGGRALARQPPSASTAPRPAPPVAAAEQ